MYSARVVSSVGVHVPVTVRQPLASIVVLAIHEKPGSVTKRRSAVPTVPAASRARAETVYSTPASKSTLGDLMPS